MQKGFIALVPDELLVDDLFDLGWKLFVQQPSGRLKCHRLLWEVKLALGKLARVGGRHRGQVDGLEVVLVLDEDVSPLQDLVHHIPCDFGLVLEAEICYLIVGTRLTEFWVDRMGFWSTFTENTSMRINQMTIELIFFGQCTFGWRIDWMPIATPVYWPCNFLSANKRFGQSGCHPKTSTKI